MPAETDRASRLVRQLIGNRVIRTPAVEAAFRAVPRHLFVPNVPIGQAYEDEVVPLKWAKGELLSSLSQPSMMAEMLELLELEDDHRVLEIGTGSGFDAALIAEIVGPGGRVTSIELDPEVADQARTNLQTACYAGVAVITGDGALGVAERAPFDRIIATAAVSAIPAAWVEQLAPGGRLVAPVERDSGQYVIAFDLVDGRLEPRQAVPCIFMLLRRPD